jgi:hypothetical protein
MSYHSSSDEARDVRLQVAIASQSPEEIAQATAYM